MHGHVTQVPKNLSMNEFSDSLLLAVHEDSLGSEVQVHAEIADDDHNRACSAVPNILSQVIEGDPPIFAGQFESDIGEILPFSIGKTDVGNGRPRPFIHIADHPSISARHVTVTVVQTNDGKFRATLRQNHPHTRVILGGSVIRPHVGYPLVDGDEIVLGDGFRFRVRLNDNNRLTQNSFPNAISPGERRQSITALPTQQYIPSPDSETSHESAQRELEERRRIFTQKSTPDDTLLLQLAGAVEASHHPPPTQMHLSPSNIITGMVDEATQSPGKVDPVDEQVDSFIQSSNEMMDDGQGESQVDDEEEQKSQVSEAPHSTKTSETVVVDQQPDTPYRAPKLSQVMEYMESAKVSPDTRQVGEKTTTERYSSSEEPPAKKLSTSRMSTRRSSSNGEEEDVPVSTRRSGRQSVMTGGPKKLIILKSACEIDKLTESALSRLGGKIETKWSPKVQALVTQSIVRTTKFMCAVNRGIPIFPKSILNEIKTHQNLPPIDDPTLWLRDPAGEAKYEFRLETSILRARESPLLRNYEVYCFKNSIGEFTQDELKDLITTAGGTLISKLHKLEDTQTAPENGGLIVIGTEANRIAARNAGVKFLNKIEFLVDCFIKQSIDFNFARVDLQNR
jgi:hypothetical protein